MAIGQKMTLGDPLDAKTQIQLKTTWIQLG